MVSVVRVVSQWYQVQVDAPCTRLNINPRCETTAKVLIQRYNKLESYFEMTATETILQQILSLRTTHGVLIRRVHIHKSEFLSLARENGGSSSTCAIELQTEYGTITIARQE